MDKIGDDCLEDFATKEGTDFVTSLIDPIGEIYDDDDNDDDNDDGFPTTDAGIEAMIVDEVTNYSRKQGHYISGHVILNQCGSVLSRREHTISGSRRQKYFLQRLASSIYGKSMPLIYPEAALFPSIFWKMLTECGSVVGAILSSLLLSSESRYGFESINKHIQSHLTYPGVATSSDPRYITFSYDTAANIAMNKSDSRTILNRGLVESTNNVGLRVQGKDDTKLHDTIDSKKCVRNLCASQKNHQMDFF